jgi:hypothetical protein
MSLNSLLLILIISSGSLLQGAILRMIFTPSHDIYGVDSKIEFKHWSCGHTLIIDARIKPHHAPPLETDAATNSKVDEIISNNEVLKKILR